MADRLEGTFDLILVGSSFASSLFLFEYLKHAGPGARVLVLERGELRSHAWQLQHRGQFASESHKGYSNKSGDKEWTANVALGGNSNCWWGNTPRFLPEDFRLKSSYGVGADWPLSYDDLEPYYCEVEELMSIAGPNDGSPSPRSRPYPLPPHRLNDPEKILKKAFPDQFFVAPSARPTTQLPNRVRCCANSFCGLCPIDSKFTVLNELMHLFHDARVKLELGAQVSHIETAGDVVTGVSYEKEGKSISAQGSVVALGANAMVNPFLLLRSGINHPLLGKGLHEQVSITLEIHLHGVDGLQGSTSLTGHGYPLYGGPRRKDRSAVLLETQNRPLLRDGRGKWRKKLTVKALFEDLPQPSNYVGISAEAPSQPEMVWKGHSPYVDRALASIEKDLEPFLAALPVEAVRYNRHGTSSEAHILGTTPMGADPEQSIVDRHLIHHRYRNLAVLGSGAFPASSPSNPTLTLSALSLWSARKLFKKG